MKIHPLRDLILVRRLAPNTKTESGLFIPDSAQDRGIEAEVVAVGPGRVTKRGVRVEPQVKVGDKIVLPSPIVRDTAIIGEKEGSMAFIEENRILGVWE
jgi:chaperonin GroES